MRVVGLDLSGKQINPSGFCLLITPEAETTSGQTTTKLLYSDEEILLEMETASPDCIGIDAPLWLPFSGLWRPAELILQKRGFRPVSPLLPSMKMLSMRAAKLVKILRIKYRIIECFSRASEQILKLSKEPRKNQDEYDALLCALTAKAYLEGNYEDLQGVIVPR